MGQKKHIFKILGTNRQIAFPRVIHSVFSTSGVYLFIYQDQRVYPQNPFAGIRLIKLVTSDRLHIDVFSVC